MDPNGTFRCRLCLFHVNPFVPNAPFLYSLYYIIDSDFICEIEIVLRVLFAFT